MNYEKFDLEKALKGEKVITRDGTPVIELHYFRESRVDYPVYGVLPGGAIQKWDKLGNYIDDTDGDPYDLFMAPKPVEEYRRVFTKGICNIAFESLDKILDAPGSAQSICKLTILNGEVISAETVHRYS